MTPSNQNSRVIPVPAWMIAGSLIVLGVLCIGFFAVLQNRDPDPFPWPFLFPMILVPPFLAGYVLVAGYIYGDARRRGMRHVMWTLLAIFVPNAIGILLYFILRDPMPVYCSRCGHRMNAGFAFCPGCGSNILPACPACGKTLQAGWSHCASCGARVGAPPLVS
jgi:hypothetical protein